MYGPNGTETDWKKQQSREYVLNTLCSDTGSLVTTGIPGTASNPASKKFLQDLVSLNYKTVICERVRERQQELFSSIYGSNGIICKGRIEIYNGTIQSFLNRSHAEEISSVWADLEGNYYNSDEELFMQVLPRLSKGMLITFASNIRRYDPFNIAIKHGDNEQEHFMNKWAGKAEVQHYRNYYNGGTGTTRMFEIHMTSTVPKSKDELASYKIKQGIRAARMKGTQIGRPPKKEVTDEEILELLNLDMSMAAVGARLGVSGSTIWRRSRKVLTQW